MIPAAIDAALGGQDFPMTPGGQERDFIYVDDVVDGFLAMARAPGIDGYSLDLGTGQVGELIVKGNGVMAGYYNNPELTSRTIVEGWLHTGDLAMRDEDGFIFLVDRKKDVINCGGENVFPVEVENHIQDRKSVV